MTRMKNRFTDAGKIRNWLKKPGKSASKREITVYRQKLALVAAGIILLIVLTGVALSDPGAPVGVLTGANEEVYQYRAQAEQACRKYGIRKFAVLLLAMMQQESGGQVPDVLQCSESPFNTEYEQYPNAITDPAYSIDVGAQTLAYSLKNAKCKNFRDMDRIRLALQDYNFGNEYAAWALENYGGYSEENAAEFSAMMQSQLGWDGYGDPEYPAHVLQYFDLKM